MPKTKSNDETVQRELTVMSKIANRSDNLVKLLGVVVFSHDALDKPAGLLMECCDQTLNDCWHSYLGLLERTTATLSASCAAWSGVLALV